MIVRVDDFPHGKEGHLKPTMDHWDALARFQDAIRAPFCLGMMTGALSDEEKQKLLSYSPDIEVAYHGNAHTHTDGENAAELRAARGMLGIDPVFIPPYNALTQKAVDTLEAEGYRYICTGPETHGGLKPTFARLVPSAFYGTAKDYLKARPKIAPLDCLTLHLTWENNDGMLALRELGDAMRLEIFQWKTFFYNRRYCEPTVRPVVAALGLHMCQKMCYDWFLDAVDVRGCKVLDFGCSDYPLATFLTKLGAEVWWHDRDEEACKRQAARAVSAGVTTHRLDGNAPKFDIIIASNSLQHNKDGTEQILAGLAGRLAQGGKVCIAAKVTCSASRWDGARPDPCWVRSVDDHQALWRSAGLQPVVRQGREVIGYLHYSWNRDTKLEIGRWEMPDRANEICALLEKAQ